MPSHTPRPISALSTLASLGLAAVLLLPSCAVQGSGNEASEVRELDAFDRVDLGGIFELTVHVDPSAAQKVEVRADDNLLPNIVTSVSDGELSLSIDGKVRPKQPIAVELWLPALVEIDGSGATNIDVEGLHGERFELDVSGASQAVLRGQVDSFTLDSSGASKTNARALEAKSVELELSGAGDVSVFASNTLDVDVSGAGKVRYWGEPAELTEEVSGAGDIAPGAP